MFDQSKLFYLFYISGINKLHKINSNKILTTKYFTHEFNTPYIKNMHDYTHDAY